MAIEAELAAAGILTLTTKTVFTRDMEIVNDLLVKDDMAVGGTVTIAGDLTVAGVLTGTFNQTYVLEERIDDLSAATGMFVVVPSDGAGYISKIRTVLLSALATSAAVLDTKNGAVEVGGTPPTTVDVDIATGSAGDVDENNGTLDSSTAGNSLLEGENVNVYPSTVGGSAASCRVQVEVTRNVA